MKINKINENQWKSVRADDNDPRYPLVKPINVIFK